MVHTKKNAHSEIQLLRPSQPHKHWERASAKAQLIRSSPESSRAKQARGCDGFGDNVFLIETQRKEGNAHPKKSIIQYLSNERKRYITERKPHLLRRNRLCKKHI